MPGERRATGNQGTSQSSPMALYAFAVPPKLAPQLKESFFSIVDFVPEKSWESLKLGLENLKPLGHNKEAPNMYPF